MPDGIRWLFAVAKLGRKRKNFATGFATDVPMLIGYARVFAADPVPMWVSCSAATQTPYTASYALGAAGSFLLAGIVEGISGWRLTFVVSAIGPLLGVAAIPLLPA